MVDHFQRAFHVRGLGTSVQEHGNALEDAANLHILTAGFQRNWCISKKLWRYWHGPCTQWDAAKLRVSETLRVLFTPPSCTQDELVDSVRFTQASASHRFRHGEHAQLDCRDLVDRLKGNLMQSEEDGMVLDVVRWHGALRSINNRHLGVLREYQDSIRNERHNAVYHDTLA